MKKTIQHFLIEIDEVRDEYPYDSKTYLLATDIKLKLEELLKVLEN